MPTVKPFLGRASQLVECRLHLRRGEILGDEAIAPADHPRHRVPLARANASGQRRHDVEVERLAGRARLLVCSSTATPCTVAGSAARVIHRGKRAIEADLQDADPSRRHASAGTARRLAAPSPRPSPSGTAGAERVVDGVAAPGPELGDRVFRQAAKQLSHSKQLPQERQRFASRSASAGLETTTTSSKPLARASTESSLAEGSASASLKIGRLSTVKSTPGCLGGGLVQGASQPRIDMAGSLLAVADRR